MFYLENKDKNNCTGCRACEKICPKDAIQMVQDSEGFIYPEIDELKCIKCGLCQKVCPNVNSVKNELIEQKVYYGVHKDEEILRKSSSGGAFTAIVEAFCDKDYIIFGCTMNEKFEVYHDYVDNKKDIIKFRKSKYLQSNVKDSYIKVKEFLKNGKKVIFTGTPCQISGLKNFLGNIKQEKLLCVDLICHGVTSQKVFNSYIEGL